MTPNPGCITASRSLADIRAEQAVNLDRLRERLITIDVRDLVPFLVGRQVLRTNEMSAVYSFENTQEQLDKLIEILKTKNHWVGPLTDALIRNGHGSVAEELMKISSSRTQKVL